jgi:hypothetical protein
MRLLIHNCSNGGEISDLKIALFTSNTDVYAEITNGYVIEDNIAIVTIPNYAFGSMEDGVINYVAQGIVGDETFVTQRQSNYFLKTPSNFAPTEIKIGEFDVIIKENGTHTFTPTDVNAWNKATITVDVADENGSYDEGYTDGYNQGLSECPECPEDETIIQDFKWVRPSMADRADDGDIYIYPDEGYDAVGYIALAPSGIYEEGYEEGYEQGQAAGGGEDSRFAKVDYFKELVESDGFFQTLSANQNGTYSALNYQGQTIAAKNAVWITEQMPSIDTEIEAWIRPLEGNEYMWNGFIGCQNTDDDNTTIQIRKVEGETKFGFRFGDSTFEYEYENNQWYYIKMNRNGVWVNGIQWNVWSPSLEDGQNSFMINGIHMRDWAGSDSFYRANRAEYGYVKINGVTYYPTENGTFITKEGEEVAYTIHPDVPYIIDTQISSGSLGYQMVAVEVQGGGGGGDAEGYWEGYETGKNEGKEEMRNEFLDNMDTLYITENGTYTMNEEKLINGVLFDGNSYFNTGIIPTENIRIEVCIRLRPDIDAGFGGVIIGGGNSDCDTRHPDRGIGITMGGGAIAAFWGDAFTWNEAYHFGEKDTIVTLQKEGHSWGPWEGDTSTFGAAPLYIGGYNWEGLFVQNNYTQIVRWIKIWTDGRDDSTMTLFRPKNIGDAAFAVVNSEGSETSYIENIGPMAPQYWQSYSSEYPYGFKEVQVDVKGDFWNGFDEGYNLGYNDGYKEGQSNCSGEDGSCNLGELVVNANGTYEVKKYDLPMIKCEGNSAFNTDVFLTDDVTWVEMWFTVGEGMEEIPTLFGAETDDYDNTGFSVRYYSDSIDVRVGDYIASYPRPEFKNDGKAHKIKVGKYVGIWIDDEQVEGELPINNWRPTGQSIYLGAMHNLYTSDNENYIFRPWNGGISTATVYGAKFIDENNYITQEWHFEVVDNHYVCVESDSFITDMNNEATNDGFYPYAKNYDGYSKVTVNVYNEIESLTQDEYDALEEKNNNIIYLIKG